MAVRVSEKRKSECRSVIGRIEVASPVGQHYLAGNGADFSLVLRRVTMGGTDAGSKANDDGANRWCSFSHLDGFSIAVRVGRKSVTRRPCLLLNKAASLFFQRGVLECLSRVRRKSHARFLEGWASVRRPGYSASMLGRIARLSLPAG